MASNGTVTAQDLTRPPEQGSVAGDRLYSSYGDYFDARRPLATVTARMVETMLRMDGKARSIEQALTLPIHSVPWSVEGDTAQARAIREDLARLDPPMDQVLAEMAGASVYGCSTHELVFEARGGRVALARIAHRPQSTTKLKVNDRTGAIEGFEQRVRRDHATKTVTIPDERSLVVIHNRHRRPLTGVSDLECAWSLFEDRMKVRYLYFSYLDNHTMPKAVGTHSSNDPVQQQEFARKIATLKGGGAIAVGPDQKIEPYEGSGRGASEYREAIMLLGREMADSVLAGFLNLTGGQTGSFALSKDQSDLFLLSRQAMLKQEQAALQTQVFRLLTAVNFGVDAPVPAFSFAPLVHEHTDAAFTLLSALATDPALLPEGFVERLAEKVGGLMDLPTKGGHTT